MAKQAGRKTKAVQKPFVVTARNIHQLMTLSPDRVVHAFKYVEKDTWDGPYFGCPHPKKYRPGTVHRVPDADPNPHRECAVGLHVATRAWCRGDVGRKVVRW